MNDLVIKFLKEKGYSNVSTDYYQYVSLWEEYWKNTASYLTYTDDYHKEHTLYNLGMAKRLCEDWASVISSEQDEITTNKRNNDTYVKQVVKDLKLKKALPECVEISSWSGTCGAIIRLNNVLVKNGVMQANKNTTMQLIKVNAKNIIPLSVENGVIKEVAIVSDSIVKNKKAIYIELHQLTKNGYKVSNIFLNAKDGKEIVNDGVISEFETNSFVPLFSLLTPPKVNTISGNKGLGMSVYADALPQIEACDITYNNFVMDFYLGGKKIFYNKKIVGTRTITDSNGNTREVPIYPDDVMKQQWKVVGDEMENINDQPLITEYNPTLRVEDNQNGVQFSLDTLSFKAGFGTKYYQFNGGSVVTATQYIGEKQDLVQNAKKYRDNLQDFVSGIIKASLLLGRVIFGKNVTEECNVEIANVDGFLQDTESLKEQWRQEIAMGLRQPWEYRVKFYGEEEEIAKEKLNNEITNVNLGE